MPTLTNRNTTISIIVVSFNTREATCDALRSICSLAADSMYEVLAIDNASQDDSPHRISLDFPEVRLIRSEKNLGFAAANNRAAALSSGNYLLLLNPDTVVPEGAIEELLSFARSRPDAGIWGGRTTFENGRLNPASCWGRATLWSTFCGAIGLTALFPNTQLFNPEGYGRWARDTVREVDIVSGCFFLIDRKLWDDLGGFDATFFMYGEEADLCLRARRLGARPVVTPEATIVHHGGASETVAADKTVRLYMAKAMLMERHWPEWQVPLGKRLLSFGVFYRRSAFACLGWFRPAARPKHATWRAVWSRRDEWQQRRVAFDSSVPAADGDIAEDTASPRTPARECA